MALLSRTNTPAYAVAFVTLGCAKNEVDTTHMQARLMQAGFSIEEDPAHADAVIVNTCSFIQSATEESIEAIFDVAGLPNVAAGAPLIVAGCMPARYGNDLAEELTEAQAFIPCSREDDIVEVLSNALEFRPPVKDASQSVYSAFPQSGAYAYVKIAEGCDRFCSFCTIPSIRGRYHSFPFKDIQAETKALVMSGVKEIVLIAQDTGRWGTDLAKPSSLAYLVSALAEEFNDVWFRLMYLEPEGVTDELLDVIASHDNICDYLDIPLQHVNASLLRSMNRSGSHAEFEALAKRIRLRIPNITLRTTLIAGFPGETDENFEELCRFVEEGLFDYVGVFSYSREEGTRAYNFPCQVDEDEKHDRAQRLRDIADVVCCTRVSNRIGSKQKVLVEGYEEDGQLYGRTQCQAPEVDGVTYLNEGKPRQVKEVIITDTLLYEMEGQQNA